MRADAKEEKRYDRVEHHTHALRISPTVPLTMLFTVLIYGLGYWLGSGGSLLPKYTPLETALKEKWSPPRSRYSDKNLLIEDRYVPLSKSPTAQFPPGHGDLPGRIGGGAVVEWPIDSAVPLPH